jgi:hypothetical protein
MNKRYVIVSILGFLLFSVVGYAAFDSMEFSSNKKLEITRITPEGVDVPAGRQIVIQFSRPVVPLGRMERNNSEIPVTITPALKGTWVWLNTSALALQLDEKNALAFSTTYRLTIRPGLKTEDGATLERPVEHTFTTFRSDVSNYDFFTWKSPVKPVIRLSFNQPVVKTSVEKHLYFSLQGRQGSRIPVTVIPDASVSRNARVSGESDEPDEEAVSGGYDEKIMVHGVEARNVWLVEPSKPLPADAGVDLIKEGGLISAKGPEKSVAEGTVLEFDTFPSFKFLGVQYMPLNGNETVLIPPGTADSGTMKADPMQGVALVFSSPVLSDEIRKHEIGRASCRERVS